MGVMECGLVNIGVMHSVIGKGRDECASCGKKNQGHFFWLDGVSVMDSVTCE